MFSPVHYRSPVSKKSAENTLGKVNIDPLRVPTPGPPPGPPCKRPVLDESDLETYESFFAGLDGILDSDPEHHTYQQPSREGDTDGGLPLIYWGLGVFDQRISEVPRDWEA
jgi:hypothetical protein